MHTKIDVPIEVRGLVVTGIDNAKDALSFFFDAVTTSSAPTSAKSLAILKRVISVQFDYARKVALAKDVLEMRALQFANCRSQVEITTDLLRLVSDLPGETSDACD